MSDVLTIKIDPDGRGELVRTIEFTDHGAILGGDLVKPALLTPVQTLVIGQALNILAVVGEYKAVEDIA